MATAQLSFSSLAGGQLMTLPQQQLRKKALFAMVAGQRRPTLIVASASADPRQAWQEAQRVQTRITIAASTGRLDLSDCGLKELPPEVFKLKDLVELSCSGNQIDQLPDEFERLCNLKRLGLSGNRLQMLPASIGSLQDLEGLWVHGNLLQTVPAQIGDLQRLKRLALAGNRLTTLPETISGLVNLQILSIAGNEIKELPTNIGALKSLRVLAAFGNLLSSVPESLTKLSALEDLWLQSNALEQLPSAFGGLDSLKQLSLADNRLRALPESFGTLPALEVVWLYSNMISELPESFGSLKKLSHAWLENNPLKADSLRKLLPKLQRVKAIGVSSDKGLSRDDAPNVSTSYVAGTGAAITRGGYFKLQAQKERSNDTEKADVLVVAFGSAPGVPNWGGLLKKVQAAMRHKNIPPVFDILYVVDSARSWYNHDSPHTVNGGETVGSYYRDELKETARDYRSVIMLGDSMGASAALMFSSLATCVLAFCPQVELTTSSIRPGRDRDWLNAFTEELLRAVSSSSADIDVHCGSWSHDVEQAKLLASTKVNVVKHGVDDHRLARELESRGKLLTIVQSKIEKALEFRNQDILVNS